MKCELLDGPQVLIVSPELATYIGLNESIFLRQLYFILTRNDAVGKMADGHKWYRDKPSEFAIKYFPFWDEGVVKRTIANLRKDGLIMARHDLNTRPRDTSLWYTINYPAVDRLDRPVDRITAKKATRKAASKYTQEGEDKQPEYTKEQNVLSSSTKVQNEPGTKVQNDPTPKELHDLKTPKETNPKGLGDKSPPVKKTPKLSEHPAIQAYRENMLRFPAKNCMQDIIDAIGDDPATVEFYGKVVKTYKLLGWNPKNHDNMFQYVKDREMPKTNTNGAKPNDRNGTTTSEPDESRVHPAWR